MVRPPLSGSPTTIAVAGREGRSYGIVPLAKGGVIEEEAALLEDIRFALRWLNPWPPKADPLRPGNDSRVDADDLSARGDQWPA